MVSKYFLALFGAVLLFGLGIVLLSCDSTVEVSPAPGIIRVTLQSDPTDTSIIVIKDTFTVSQGDSFGVAISQGKIYNGDNFATLFINLNSNDIEATYNILKRENGEYKKYTVYETYVPPDNYDKLQFVANARLLRLKYFLVPVQLPEGVSPLLDFNCDFEVFENDTTEINMQISPFKSVVRFKDSYYFTREMMIVGVKYY